MKIRQIKWLGRLTKLPENTPSKTTLKYKETLKTSRSTKSILEKNDGKNINYYSVNWDSTKEMAKDREHCKNLADAV